LAFICSLKMIAENLKYNALHSCVANNQIKNGTYILR
jgi:hypothetical protein